MLKEWSSRPGQGSLLLLAVVLLVVLPLSLDAFRLNLAGKYLSLAFAAVGLVMLWGHAGILSLGQGVFFGLGGYAMAMFLKIEASSVADTASQFTPGIPDFMDWSQLTALPAFWKPFANPVFALLAVVVLPVLVAAVMGLALFRRRVNGVYFSIITQAVAMLAVVLVVGFQAHTGGVNGITGLRTFLGWDIRSSGAQRLLYVVSAILLLSAIALCQWLQRGKLGTLLLAMRDREERVRFSGYDVASYQLFVFCLAAALAGIGGALFTLQVGFMSPSLMGIVPSIELVIFAAVGGRMSLVGAVCGTLLVCAGKTLFSERFPDAWMFLMAALFIGVTMAFPMGMAGLWERFMKGRNA